MAKFRLTKSYRQAPEHLLPSEALTNMPGWWPPEVPVFARLAICGATRNSLLVPRVVVELCDLGGAGNIRATLSTLVRLGTGPLQSVLDLGGVAALSAVLQAERQR